jgi:dihydroxy-acid dehydratase
MTMQSYGEFVSGSISKEERKYVLHNSCPGAGSCGGMYTPNTVASAIETMGMSLSYRCKIMVYKQRSSI